MLLRFIKWLTGWEPCEHKWEQRAEIWSKDACRPDAFLYWCPKCLKTKRVE
jgi:hypothetical protein